MPTSNSFKLSDESQHPTVDIFDLQKNCRRRRRPTVLNCQIEDDSRQPTLLYDRKTMPPFPLTPRDDRTLSSDGRG